MKNEGVSWSKPNEFGMKYPGDDVVSVGGDIPMDIDGVPFPVYWGRVRAVMVELSGSWLVPKRIRRVLAKVVLAVDGMLKLWDVVYVDVLANGVMVPLMPERAVIDGVASSGGGITAMSTDGGNSVPVTRDFTWQEQFSPLPGGVVGGITGEAVPAKLGVSGFDHIAGRVPGESGNEALQQYERIMKRYDTSVAEAKKTKKPKTVWDIMVAE